MEENLYPSKKILIVDDEVHLLKSFELTLYDSGINNIHLCNDSRIVMDLLENEEFIIVMLDLSMPHKTGEELLAEINKEYPEILVTVITGNNDLESAVSCMKNGAFDYLVKPVESSRLVSTIKRAIEIKSLRDENSLLKTKIFKDELNNPDAFSEIITQNEKMRAMFHYMEAISKTTEPILITGETGAGKELIAKALHKLCNRKGKFITVNVAGLDDHMFTDTLFGHKKGAFTGAETARDGLIEKAHGGVLFLDEIGDLSQASQVKLLRLLQEHEYYPLGVDEPKFTDALIIVATNLDLFELKETGKFRKDLFYRLNVHHIQPLPLRKRIDDLPLLIEHFLNEAADSLQKAKPTIPGELITLLSTYHFPGNIRELKAMIFDAVSMHKSRILSTDSFKKAIEKGRSLIQNEIVENIPEQSLVNFSMHLPTLKQVQDLLIREALKRSNQNQSVAAQLLGITRQALSKRLKDK